MPSDIRPSHTKLCISRAAPFWRRQDPHPYTVGHEHGARRACPEAVTRRAAMGLRSRPAPARAPGRWHPRHGAPRLVFCPLRHGLQALDQPIDGAVAVPKRDERQEVALAIAPLLPGLRLSRSRLAGCRLLFLPRQRLVNSLQRCFDFVVALLRQPRAPIEEVGGENDHGGVPENVGLPVLQRQPEPIPDVAGRSKELRCRAMLVLGGREVVPARPRYQHPVGDEEDEQCDSE